MILLLTSLSIWFRRQRLRTTSVLTYHLLTKNDTLVTQSSRPNWINFENNSSSQKHCFSAPETGTGKSVRYHHDTYQKLTVPAAEYYSICCIYSWTLTHLLAFLAAVPTQFASWAPQVSLSTRSLSQSTRHTASSNTGHCVPHIAPFLQWHGSN